MTSYSPEAISAALNRAADDICEAAELPDSGTRDALNLLVNAAVFYLERPKAALKDVAAESYTTSPAGYRGRWTKSDALAEIVGWINE